MTFALGALLLPLLLVFGLYHFLIWLNLFRINSQAFWKRAALASAIAHVLLVSGFFILTYLDFRANRPTLFGGQPFDSFLFRRSEFWTLMLIFDPLPTALILGLFALLDRLGFGLPSLVGFTIGVVYLVGTAQWYVVGGGVAAVFEKIWQGLKEEEY